MKMKASYLQPSSLQYSSFLKEGAKQAALILKKNSHFNRTPLYVLQILLHGSLDWVVIRQCCGFPYSHCQPLPWKILRKVRPLFPLRNRRRRIAVAPQGLSTLSGWSSLSKSHVDNKKFYFTNYLDRTHAYSAGKIVMAKVPPTGFFVEPMLKWLSFSKVILTVNLIFCNFR